MSKGTDDEEVGVAKAVEQEEDDNEVVAEERGEEAGEGDEVNIEARESTAADCVVVVEFILLFIMLFGGLLP